MQPVPCWEKMWVVPDGAPVGSSFKVYKWVKTDKSQVRIYVSGIIGAFELNVFYSNSATMKERQTSLSRLYLTSRRQWTEMMRWTRTR